MQTALPAVLRTRIDEMLGEVMPSSRCLHPPWILHVGDKGGTWFRCIAIVAIHANTDQAALLAHLDFCQPVRPVPDELPQQPLALGRYRIDRGQPVTAEGTGCLRAAQLNAAMALL